MMPSNPRRRNTLSSLSSVYFTMGATCATVWYTCTYNIIYVHDIRLSNRRSQRCISNRSPRNVPLPNVHAIMIAICPPPVVVRRNTSGAHLHHQSSSPKSMLLP
jgi:hypothetical protein